MGTIHHHAIIVTVDSVHGEEIAEKAREIFGERAAGPIPSLRNGYVTIFVAPDGSKEWWDISDACDAQRLAFRLWLRSLRASDEVYPDAVEVSYGELENTLNDIVGDDE
jgi:hypothetical protein